MGPRRAAGWVLLGVLGVGLVACRKQEATPAPAPDPQAARRGRSLFQRGESMRGEPLVGLLGPERVELSGPVAACARCHGPAGRGSLEGGVAVPDIRPDALRRPRVRGVADVEDFSRPAYDRATLLRAITQGVSASGRTLGVTMPRYVLGEAEREELLAYLDRLGDAPDPGITATTLTFGAALPLSGRLGPVGQDVEAVLRAAFAEVNARGGLFRRRLELKVVDDAALYADGALAGPDATTRLLDEGVLALVSSLRKGPLASDMLLRREGVPLVLPIALGAGSGDDDSPIFFLYPQESEQARMVVQHLARADEENVLRKRPLVVVRADDKAARAWAQAAREEALRRELPAPTEVPLVGDAPEPGALGRLNSTPPAILYAGPAAGLKALLGALETRRLETPVFAPASLADPSVVAGSTRRVLFVYPPGMEGRAEHLQTFTRFLQRHGLQPRHVAFQLSAYASVQVLVESLTRAGADVTRADLLLRLEELRDFDTGVTPPVTFGVNRRVGVQGAQLVRLHAQSGQLEAASAWIPLSP